MNEKELIGVTLGNSTIERLLGRGGMALVFLAQQARPTRTVAVKVLLPDVQGSSADQQRVFLERFRREADTAAKLEHKNILPIFEYAEAWVNGQSVAYLVMPYIRGGSLRQRIDDRVHSGEQFDLSTVAGIISQVADALSYAHSLGVVHRDVKPANLLFHSDGRLLLTDFGIARLVAMPALTMVGSFIGTVEYASPEQVSAGELDARSDIYSLGVILYELLTGSVPFTGSTPFEIMSRHLHDPVPSVRTQRPDLSPAIEFVVRKALAKDPKDRYQHAGELAADLQAAIMPALVQAGLRLSGDAGNADLTVADSAWQPPARVVSPVPTPVGQHADVMDAGAVSVIPPTMPSPISQPPASAQPPAVPYPVLPPGGATWQPAGGAQVQVQVSPAKPDLTESQPVKTYRTSRRLFFYVVGLVSVLLQFLVLGLTLHQPSSSDTSTIVLGVLLGNALNLLALAAIAFTAVTRQRDPRGVLRRAIWVPPVALVLSGFFISYGDFSSHALNLPLISYLILLVSNIYLLRQLSRADAGREQVEIAPIAWQAAVVGALTGLIPLIIILVFALLVPLPWVAGSSLFLRLLGLLTIALIGAPTPGAMLAVWLSRRMSFPILIRTSALAGLFMFLAAYVIVVLLGLLATGQTFAAGLSQPLQPLAILLLGGLLGLVGLLRGLLDAWIYYRVILRKQR